MQWPALGALLCFGYAFLSGFTNPLKAPTVTLTDITLQGISLPSSSTIATVKVDNTNPIGITLADVTFDLFYVTGDGEKYLGHGGQENLTVKGGGVSSFEIPVEVGNVQAIQAAAVLVKEKSLTLVARGTAAVDLKITTVKIPFEKRQVVS
jgi:LEA14-like dessication related protein